jgi:ABC-2 type transport system ATP-binding protein
LSVFYSIGVGNFILTKSIIARALSKTYSYYEKEAGLSGSLKSLFRVNKVEVKAVKEIDFEVNAGEVVGFIGPNGAGKTTTLKMLCGILYPTSGHLEVNGFSPFRRDKAFLQSITFLTGQRDRLFWDLPASEYFEFCKVIYEIPKETFNRNIKRLVEMAEIGDILKTPQRKLSFGQRKRCELVASLLHDPKVIFLDEPTNAMDLINAKKLRDFIKEQGKESNRTIIITSHNMSDIENVCHRVVIINRGAIVFDDTIEILKRMHGFRRQIRIFFSGPWEIEGVANLGDIIKQNDREVILEIDAEKTLTITTHLFKTFPVKDINIEGLGLERIIESIYLKANN